MDLPVKKRPLDLRYIQDHSSLPLKKRPLDLRKIQDHDQAHIDDGMPEGHDQNPVDVMPEGQDQNPVDVMPDSSSSQSSDGGEHEDAVALPLAPLNWSNRSPRSHRIPRFTGWAEQYFLFEKRIAPEDIERSRLAIPWAIAEWDFPPHRPPYPPTQILISSTLNPHWPMTVSISPRSRSYLITQGWPEFAAAHNLEAMDVVRFYRAKYLGQVYHFVVKCEKAKKTESNVIQSGKQKHHGNKYHSKKQGGHGGNQEPAPVQ